jgi:hypothetical protein
MPSRNPCKLLHPTYIHSLCWSLKRGVKRIWIGSAFPTNESGEVQGSQDLRATSHLEAGPIRCVRGLKSSLVVGQKAQIGPNPFTLRGRADLVV